MAIPACNVYQPAGRRFLWHFHGAGSASADLKPARELALAGEAPPPKSAVAKGWSTLFSHQLNVAWLPPGAVFLHALQLPVMPREELVAAVEFQLERISPLPVTHIVWSLEVLPQIVGGQQTVVVMIAARQQVEQILRQLEAQGFMADRLEVPAADHLLSADPKQDGLWLYPPQEGTEACWIAAWWTGGLLRSIGLIFMPENENRSTVLKQQLAQMAWAGEVEGWLTNAPRWYLVGDSVVSALWEPVIREVAGESVTVVAPPPLSRLASLTVKRAAGAIANKLPGLLPADVLQGYRARYVDGLWLSSLTSFFAIYLCLALAYFGYLEFLKLQLNRSETQVAALSGTYTNALQLREQIQMLQDQQNFKYAALEVWDAVARALPEGLTLKSMNFSKEKTLMLYGTAGDGSRQQVLDFNNALKQVEFNGRPLFAKVQPPFLGTLAGGSVNWNFACELNRLE